MKSTLVVDIQHHQILVVKTCGVYKISEIWKVHLSLHVYSMNSLSTVDISTSIHLTVGSTSKLTLSANNNTSSDPTSFPSEIILGHGSKICLDLHR